MVRQEEVKFLKLWSGSGRVTGRPPGLPQFLCVYMASREIASGRWGLSRCHAVTVGLGWGLQVGESLEVFKGSCEIAHMGT